MELILIFLLLFAPHIFGQGLLSVLATHEELSKLNSHLNTSKTLSFLLSTADNFTFLAPSDSAFELLDSQSTAPLTEDEIDSLVLYHFLKGGFPTLSISLEPQFAISHLINTKGTNVTGGQVVEVVSDPSGNPTFLSGNKTTTTIFKAVGSPLRSMLMVSYEGPH